MDRAAQSPTEVTMQVRLFPLSQTSGALVAIVSTPIGSAVLTVDLTDPNDVPLTAEMPSGTTYGSTVAFWNSHASGDPELDAREVIGSAVAFVIECLEQESRGGGVRELDAIPLPINRTNSRNSPTELD
jgi:hypothetical protein